jgi:uncharacterized protein (TIGR02246 family)
MTAEKELLDLEKKYWQALKDGDVKAALQLTDDPCVVTGAQGAAKIDHKAFAAMMDSPRWKIIDFEISHVHTRMLAPDVGVVAYKVREELLVEGHPLTLEAADASTWVRRNGRWLCALHTESVAGDPFGRDRRAT